MAIISNIRKNIGVLALKSEIKKVSREKKICNLSEANKIGIVYYLPDEETYNKVTTFVKRLQEMGKSVKALGYVENKGLTGYFLPKLSYDFLYPSGLSWNFKPVSDAAKDFMQSEYDILIDLTTEDILPLLYVTGLSKARFKTGMQSDAKNTYLDLMISLSEDGELDELIEQIDHYLSIINKENES